MSTSNGIKALMELLERIEIEDRLKETLVGKELF